MQRRTNYLKKQIPKFYWEVLLVLVIGVILFLVILSTGKQVAPVKAQGPAPQTQGEVYASEPVTPGLSPPVWSLPTVETRRPGHPVYEVNPRQPGGYVPEIGLLETAPPFPSAHSSTKTPALIQQFIGQTLVGGGRGVPPDTVGDVGPNHYVQMVNSSFAIWDKSGNPLKGQTDINTLWTDGTVCQIYNSGDPIVLYDRQADRWMMTQFGHNPGPATPFYQCIAVSQTPEPTGAWYTYSFETDPDGKCFNDYGKFGVWPDGYYMGANECGFTAYVFDRNKMLTGAPATFQRTSIGMNMMLPSDLDGPTPPPGDAPNYFYTMGNNNRIWLYEFHVDWANPANSMFLLNAASPLISSGFTFDVCPGNPANNNSWNCIPQKGVEQLLDAIGEWPMFRLQYRNHGAYESLVSNFTVDTNPAAGIDHAAPHWFELRKIGGGNWFIQDEGDISPDTAIERWMGSAAMDGDGNIAVGYSASSSNMFPDIRYVTRLVADPAGAMGTEVILYPGAGSQTIANRWGDYSGMSVDPSDDCTFWYTNEYISADGWWETRIGSFKISSCGILVKKVDDDAPQPGQTITYTIVAANGKNFDLTNAVIFDTMPTGINFVGPVTLDPPGAGTIGVAPPTLVSSLTITAGERITVTYPVTVSTSLTLGTTIINTAAITSTQVPTPITINIGITVNTYTYLPMIPKN